AAVLVHGQVGHFIAVFLQALTGVQGRLVLGDLRDDVIALLAIHFGDALDRQIRGFCGAAGEHNLFGRGVDQLGDLPARILHRLFRLPAVFMVAAGGVAVLVRKIRNHCFDDARIHLRRRVIIKKNWKLYRHSLSPQSPSVFVAASPSNATPKPVLLPLPQTRNSTISESGASSVICEIVTLPSTARMLSLTRRKGS